MFSLDDTITAIATPAGTGGVGIVKISGDQALPIIQKIFHPKAKSGRLKPRYLHFGFIQNPRTQHPIDEALVAYMPGPHSYTGQDVVEIQAHSGAVPLQQILQLILTEGARAAEAGEMTLRAFLNGRLDLAQAEAVLDIIHAKTEAGLRIATSQLNGGLSNKISDTRQKLVNALAYIEATIDFIEEDIPLEDITPTLQDAIDALQALASTASQGVIYRQGVRAAIVGKPNVGKSSLLNALLRGERAIVTDIPGTTRDTLEETINLDGIPFILVDTAGIRAEPSDAVEEIGINRSRAALNQADLALMVVDLSQGITAVDLEISQLIEGKPTVLILNKIDLKTDTTSFHISDDFLPNAPRLQLSALKLEGVEDLENQLKIMIMGGEVVTTDNAMISNPRHQALLVQAIDHTQSAIEAQQVNLSPDLISIDVREAVDALGAITGENASEDLLNTIFSKFCIGK
ncbi:MAG: tRNA uridine-5-carboxymethylaminomethyl(34) synthesis GTPase MnmE [Chloroflexota bacterium]